MGKFFQYDNHVMEIFRKASDVFFCGICFFISCLPIITIGAALSSMYRMMFNLREDKNASISAYFQCFRKEFKKSTVLWLLCLVCIGIPVIVFNLIFLKNSEGVLFTFFFGMLFFFIIAWAFTFSYVFPLEAYFDNTTIKTVINGFFISISHGKETIISLILFLLPILGYLISPHWFLRILPVWVFLVIPAVFYFTSYFYQTVFNEYIKG